MHGGQESIEKRLEGDENRDDVVHSVHVIDGGGGYAANAIRFQAEWRYEKAICRNKK